MISNSVCSVTSKCRSAPLRSCEISKLRVCRKGVMFLLVVSAYSKKKKSATFKYSAQSKNSPGADTGHGCNGFVVGPWGWKQQSTE